MNYSGLKSKQTMLSYSITITIISTIISGIFGFLLALLIVSNEMVECLNKNTCSFIDPGVLNDYLSSINLSSILAGSLGLLYAFFIAFISYHSIKQDFVNNALAIEMKEKGLKL